MFDHQVEEERQEVSYGSNSHPDYYSFPCHLGLRYRTKKTHFVGLDGLFIFNKLLFKYINNYDKDLYFYAWGCSFFPRCDFSLSEIGASFHSAVHLSCSSLIFHKAPH